MNYKETKGITLIALIITIIILIILAAVSLNAIFRNRILDTATEGVRKLCGGSAKRKC